MMAQKVFKTRLSLVGLVLLGVVEDSVALPTQVPAVVTENEGLRLSIIVVVTQRLCVGNRDTTVIARKQTANISHILNVY